ncbi:MAG: excinuclease ABC subunit UvrA [Frankiaceae bacterium]|nr:excinuclease ABC subunit UvrA [Frankiaceae bacterium]
MADRLVVRGAREHNLKDVSLDLPRDALIVFTGLSGSGKSSLAFDTIFAEGQRRYVESLSAYARQFLGQMDKPDVDFIEGLSPAVSIDQKSTSRNPRSTVGTITEVYDYLRLLYARAGTPHCPQCGRVIARQQPSQIVDRVLELEEGSRFQILAPVIRGRKGEYVDLFADLQTKGYSRARVDGVVHSLAEPPKLKKQEKHTIEVVVDRLTVKGSAKRRLTDSIETALGLGSGLVVLDFVDKPEDDPERERTFSEHLACLYDDLSFEELEPRSFSFNSPYGACPECHGLGVKKEVDPELVITDEEASFEQGVIAPWSSGHNIEYFGRLVQALGDALGFTLKTPWKKLKADQQKAVLYGHPTEVHVRYRNRYGRERSYYTAYEGVIPFLERRHSEAESETSRDRFEGYMREVPCGVCQGARLKPEVLAVTLGDKSIADVAAMSIGDCAIFLRELELTERQATIAERVVKEVNARLGFLLDVGLDYLSLDRAAGTLAGGEAQRIRLATQIGSGLVGVLYVLDEPSIGLHQRDNRRLIDTLLRLKSLGNTLIVVEHDEDTINTADWVVDIGPGAGEHGGHIVVSGSVEDLLASPDSITGMYLSGRREIAVPEVRRPATKGRELVVVGAREHNLRDVTVTFPLGQLVAVTGVSGSGKSTLVNDILATVLVKQLNGNREVPGRHTRVTGLEHLDKVVRVDQSPIGRTPRSNPATYTGVFDHMRKLFAETTEAKVRGYLPGRFSFNVKGGRCEACSGDGTIKIEMNFLPDVYVPCEVCDGARYNRETLEVHFKGKSISEVLDMPIEQAAEFFEAVPAIRRHLQTLVEVGLGYVRLGQPAPTLSGGEAQRVKLASELQKRQTGRTIYVLDEPTTGLHFEDINKLLGVLQRLVDGGNSVIVIEHNLDVIKCADHVIDMGPEGGSGGGTVVAEGTPEHVATVEASHTGRFLGEILAGRGGLGHRSPAGEPIAPGDAMTRASAKAPGTAPIKMPAAKKPVAKKAPAAKKTVAKKAPAAKRSVAAR